MTQIFDDKGVVHPATVLQTGPMVVTQIKTVETDGYNAVQVGFGTRNAKNINKAMKGHMKEGNFMYLREFRMDDVSPYKVGDVVPFSFTVGDVVALSSISKGKGFQGAVKRHGFKGGPRSHGQKHSEREVGSIGGGGRDGGRVAKGKRMAGRMGGDKITSKGLTIVGVNTEANEVYVRGAVSGRRGTLVEVLES
ncbi:MAG: large subunit ribosomal protein L3 [Parcubacteria group bacterium Gr01-1014_46]|nr:MAG: large subunit ribosomal protein L3 [Parcubacteria group bacterium Gr01-1014_46]